METLTPADLSIHAKTEVLLEALPYIQRFRGATFVIKYGGSFMDDPDPVARARVATDIAFLAAVGIQVVVVHGGGKAISRGMAEAGLTPEFKNGLRVTDAESIKIVERVLNKEVNYDICTLIQGRQGRPLSLPGNNVFICEREVAEDDEGQPVDLGFVGKIHYVKTKLIKKAINDGFTPIVSPIALDDERQPHNTNADVAAAATAAALRARRLFFLCDVPGLLRDPTDPGSLISTLHVDEVEGLKREGVIAKGMIPKVDSAVRALAAGVHRVHFVDGRQPHSLLLEIFTDRGVGTEIVNS
ncbi:MAG: acetylglutamate kinase [Opitutales bacterium]